MNAPFTPPLIAVSVSDLPAVNAMLNAAAGILLVYGLALIRRGHERAHKRVMLTAFAVSIVFLASYLTYHLRTHAVTRFTDLSPVRYLYYAILISHVILAATVPFLAMATIYLGLRDRRAAHRRLARWTWPIWMYVSVTGVVIYVMLYHLYAPPKASPTIPGVRAKTSLAPVVSAPVVSVVSPHRSMDRNPF